MVGMAQPRISNVWKFVLAAILLFGCLPAQAHVRLPSLADSGHDPVTGRVLSPDPARFADNRNLYALTGNDPVNKADPDGRISSRNMASVFMPQYGVSAQYGSYGTRNWEYDQNSTKKIVHTVGAQVAAMGGGAVGAAVAAPVVAGLGLSGGTAAFTVGAVAGASGDALMQGFQIAVGDRQRFSGTEVVMSAAAAGAINYAGYALTSPRTANAGAVLPERETGNFVGRPSQVTISEGEVLYGVRDAGSRNVWWTRTQPAGELQWRMDQAVLPEWNQATHIETLTVPPGQSLVGFEGVARGQSWYLGGGNQVYIPNVPSGWSTIQPWR